MAVIALPLPGAAFASHAACVCVAAPGAPVCDSDFKELVGPSTPEVLAKLQRAYGCVMRSGSH